MRNCLIHCKLSGSRSKISLFGHCQFWLEFHQVLKYWKPDDLQYSKQMWAHANLKRHSMQNKPSMQTNKNDPVTHWFLDAGAKVTVAQVKEIEEWSAGWFSLISLKKGAPQM